MMTTPSDAQGVVAAAGSDAVSPALGAGGDVLLAVRGLGIGFSTEAGLRPAVSDVSFDIAPGQVLALVGESGSGKSVTALAILGLLPSSAQVCGSISLTGTQLVGADQATLRRVRGGRIGAVFQEPFTAFNPVMRIGSQIEEAIGVHEPRGRDEATSRVLDLLRRVGLDEPDRVYASFPHQLSGGQLQRAMIAMAISCSPDLLIADEPTTALDVTVQAGILDLLRQLRRELGMAVLLITHDMGVVAELADDVVVLRYGEVQEAGPVEQVLLSPTAGYTKDLLAAVPRIDIDEAPAPAGTGPTEASVGSGGQGEAADNLAGSGEALAVDVRHVSVAYGSGRKRFVAVEDVDLAVPTGATVGLVGESGSGKTTLGLAIARLLPTASGVIEVAGRNIASLGAGALRRARQDIGFVFQDPVASLNPRQRIGYSIAAPLRVHTAMSGPEKEARVAELLRSVRLPETMAGRYPHELSGGERQRVAIARALALRPQLVIADEPTSALDVSVQASILTLLADLQAEFGFGCLFISHDLAVVRQVCHQVAVLRHGKLVEFGPTNQVLAHPRDPYTQALLAAVPSPDPRKRPGRGEWAPAGGTSAPGGAP